MQQIREVTFENKTLRRHLNREYLKLFNEMDFYLRLHDLTTNQYNEITNKILVDFNRRLNEEEKIWESIDNPKNYVDSILMEHQVQENNYIVNILRKYGPLVIGIFSIYCIKSDIFFPLSERTADTLMLNFTFESLLRTFASILLFSMLIFVYYKQLFVQKKKILLPIILFLIYTAFLMYLEGIDKTIMFSFAIPIIVPYLTLGISILIKVIDRKRLWL